MRPGLVASRSGKRMPATLGAGACVRQPLADERAITIPTVEPVVSRGARCGQTREGRSMGLRRVDITESFARFKEQWSPKIVGELNGQMVKLVRFQGEFVWHHHEHEDEMFLVVDGTFRMELRD